MSTLLDETFKRAVTPGPERLLAGVALAAAGSDVKDTQDEDFCAAYGTLQLDPATAPVSSKTVMWLASCSKLVTSVAALQCVERGDFDLDSSVDVDRLLPELNQSGPQILTGFEDGQPQLQPAKEKITLRLMLSHSSGLGYDFMPPLLNWRQSRGEAPSGMRRPLGASLTQPLIFEPGTSFGYGSGLEVTGLMVARANNCTLEEYMREHIFDVVGMHDTSFYPQKHGDMATRIMPPTARPDPDGPLVNGMDPKSGVKVPPLEPFAEFGGGGLWGTAEDYLKLLKSILRNDGRLLKPETADLLFTSAISLSSTSGLLATLSNPTSASHMMPGEAPVGTPGAGDWTHSVGGLVGLTDKEWGLKAPWLQWGGALNLDWWIDRNGGSCGIFATQLSPRGEEQHKALWTLFQKEMVRKFRRSGA